MGFACESYKQIADDANRQMGKILRLPLPKKKKEIDYRERQKAACFAIFVIFTLLADDSQRRAKKKAEEDRERARLEALELEKVRQQEAQEILSDLSAAGEKLFQLQTDIKALGASIDATIDEAEEIIAEEEAIILEREEARIRRRQEERARIARREMREFFGPQLRQAAYSDSAPSRDSSSSEKIERDYFLNYYKAYKDDDVNYISKRDR